MQLGESASVPMMTAKKSANSTIWNHPFPRALRETWRESMLEVARIDIPYRTTTFYLPIPTLDQCDKN